MAPFYFLSYELNNYNKCFSYIYCGNYCYKDCCCIGNGCYAIFIG